MEGARQGPPASATRRPGPGSRPRSFKTECVVLRSRDMREADRLVTLLTPSMGKLTVTVRGARKTTSRLGGHLDVLNRANLTLALGHRIDVVTGAESLETFGGVKADLEASRAGPLLHGAGGRAAAPGVAAPRRVRGAARRASRARGRHSVRGGPALRRAAAARRRRLPARAAALPRVRQGGRAGRPPLRARTRGGRVRHVRSPHRPGDATLGLGAQGAQALRRAWVRGRGPRQARSGRWRTSSNRCSARRCNTCWSGRWRRPVSWSTCDVCAAGSVRQARLPRSPRQSRKTYDGRPTAAHVMTSGSSAT